MKYNCILLIDDDEDDQEIFITALRRVTHETKCIAFSNAHNALLQLRSKAVVPDIIFLDLNMPIMNGQQFLTEIKSDQALSHLPVIVFSTSAHPQTIQSAKETGAEVFITKPDKFDDLIAILRSVLG